MDVTVVGSEKRSVLITGMYPDDFDALVELLAKSGSPQFEAVAAILKERSEGR